MRIERSRSRLTFRKRRRRSAGCLSILFSIALVIGVGMVGWLWFNRLTNPVRPGSTSDLMASAQNAFSRGDLSGAISLARQVLSDQPDDSGALTLLVRALVYRSYAEYNRASDRDVALEATSAMLATHPADPDVLAIHAFALQAMSQADDAADTARRVLEANPDHALARTSLALAYGSVGAYEAALRESQHAVQAATTADDGLDALRALAIASSDTGSYDTAVRTVERAMTHQRQPRHALFRARPVCSTDRRL